MKRSITEIRTGTLKILICPPNKANTKSVKISLPVYIENKTIITIVKMFDIIKSLLPLPSDFFIKNCPTKEIKPKSIIVKAITSVPKKATTSIMIEKIKPVTKHTI